MVLKKRWQSQRHLRRLVVALAVLLGVHLCLASTDALASTAKLRLIGERGASQSALFRYRRCERAADGSIARLSCETGDHGGTLGEWTRELEPGAYVLNYSGSLAIVNVGSGAALELPLTRIAPPALPDGARMTSFKAVRSLETREGKALELMLRWGGFGFSQSSVEDLCGWNVKPGELGRLERLELGRYCKGWRALSADSLSETVVTVSEFAVELLLPSGYLVSQDKRVESVSFVRRVVADDEEPVVKERSVSGAPGNEAKDAWAAVLPGDYRLEYSVATSEGESRWLALLRVTQSGAVVTLP